jgi:hypothetical protein
LFLGLLRTKINGRSRHEACTGQVRTAKENVTKISRKKIDSAGVDGMIILK